jgi:hypothetical protein
VPFGLSKGSGNLNIVKRRIKYSAVEMLLKGSGGKKHGENSGC